ncbi:molecular chaperone [Leclercia barmai]|uniref:fimbrial biogenesis chaperone n=1 Tax=Leclercia TaxID=83654 RepID=UPI00057ACA74|nr:molecular chaperone [Leclercia adecarboxylata]
MKAIPGYRTLCLLMALGATLNTAHGAATILLWPIDPWLSADTKATELWVQNQGNSATTMQVRIVRWRQENGLERYTAQQEVVASPPIVTIAKGSKQLIRLIKQSNVPAGVEQAYRIIVDEIPQPQDNQTPQMGLKLQMRYSIPLFVYGQGIATIKDGAHHALVETRDLNWRVVRDDGKPALQVRNQGNVHVRLSQVTLQQGSQKRTLADGLLGYVLPGSTRSWPLPSGIDQPGQMRAQINARDTEWQSAPVN